MLFRSKNITNYVNGITKNIDLDIVGIQDTAQAAEYLNYLINSDYTHIAADSETSSLYARNGNVLGVCLSHKEQQGVYIDADCITEDLEVLFQKLFDCKTIIFHNSKFDIRMLNYHFNWTFPNFEDTLLLHYCLNEQPGTHDLKQLALKYTDLGDYDKENHKSDL